MLNWLKNLTYKVENKAVDSTLVYQLTSGYYHDVIQKEITLANITEDDNILCIGGGLCPFSAILFHQLTGAKVTVIDNNLSCVPRAKSVITRLGLNDRVRVLHADGGANNVSFADFTVVHIALQVSPMEQVFSAVESKVKIGTRLLVRRPKKSLKGMYNKVARALSPCPYAMHKLRNIGSTALYIKQGVAS